MAVSGCGAVGRAVASDTREPGFKSDKNKEKEARNGPFKKDEDNYLAHLQFMP